MEINTENLDELLQCPSDFGYHGDLDMFSTWSLGPVIETRDSGLLEKSNSKALIKALEEQCNSDDWEITSCNHWAVGWCDHLSFRVYNDDGSMCDIVEWLKEWFDALSDYPVADESDYSEREMNATIENIEDAASGMVIDNPPEDWSYQCWSWFWDNNQSAIENHDDNGGYPSREEMVECLEALGLLEEDEC